MMNLKDTLQTQSSIPFEERLALFSKNNVNTYKKSRMVTFKTTTNGQSNENEHKIEKLKQNLSLLNLKKVVFGKFVKRLKGGFLIEFEKYQGFLPFSQYTLFVNLIPNLEKLIGTYSEFEILNVSIEPFVIILSRKSLQLNPEDETKRKEILIDVIAEQLKIYQNKKNQENQVALSILQKAEEKFNDSTFEIKTVEEIQDILNERIEDTFDDLKNNDYYEEGPYCTSCQQAPCMCSDPERTSTSWNY
jgi:hypothetical protein